MSKPVKTEAELIAMARAEFEKSTPIVLTALSFPRSVTAIPGSFAPGPMR